VLINVSIVGAIHSVVLIRQGATFPLSLREKVAKGRVRGDFQAADIPSISR
jgi:hypothetical protein